MTVPRYQCQVRTTSIIQGSGGDPIFVIMKDIDILGKPPAVAVQRRGACDMAFRVSMQGQDPKEHSFGSQRAARQARSISSASCRA